MLSARQCRLGSVPVQEPARPLLHVPLNRYRYSTTCNVDRSSTDTGVSSEDGPEGADDASRDAPASDVSNIAPDMPYSFLAAISSVGFVITGYLTWSKLTNSAVTCPVGDPSGCSNILNSAYASVLGLPLPLLGMLGYGAVAWLTLSSWAVQSSRARDATPFLNKNSNLIAYGTAALAGTSAVLAVTLREMFPEQFCAFCVASAMASFTLFFTTASFVPGGTRVRSLGSFVVTAAALAAIYSTYPTSPDGGTFDVAFNAPVVTESSPDGARALATRLRDAGAQFYGAFWCSHCFDQKQLFGRDAVDVLPYVECYPDGFHGVESIARVCRDAGVQGFPTWVINGQVIEGDWPLDFLASVLDGAEAALEEGRYGL